MKREHRQPGAAGDTAVPEGLDQAAMLSVVVLLVDVY